MLPIKQDYLAGNKYSYSLLDVTFEKKKQVLFFNIANMNWARVFLTSISTLIRFSS